MSLKYLDMLPSNCENKESGVCRAVMIEDMLKHKTYFFGQQLNKDKNKYELFYLNDVSNILFEIYNRPTEPVFIWNKELRDEVGLFQFSEKDEKVCMVVKISQDLAFKQTLLRELSRVGGEEMAKICPKDNKYVLYLDCLECEDKADCGNKGDEE